MNPDALVLHNIAPMAGQAIPAAMATSFAGAPSTSGWDIVYAISIPSINNLLQSQFALASTDNVPNPLQPITAQVPFAAPGVQYILYVNDFQLSSPTVAIDATAGTSEVNLTFYVLGGTFLEVQGTAASQTLISFSTLLPNTGNTLAGNVPLTGGLDNQAVTFNLQGGSQLVTQMQIGSGAGGFLATEIQSVLETGNFAATYAMGQLGLPTNGLFQPALTSFATQQSQSPGDTGRLLYLVATQVEPGGGSVPGTVTTQANFVAQGGGTCDLAMVYSYQAVLNQLLLSINSGISKGMASPPTYALVTNASTPADTVITLSGDLTFDNVKYNYGGNESFDIEIMTNISGNSQVMMHTCQLGILPNFSNYTNPVGFYNPAPSSSTIQFQMNVSQTINQYTQNIPNTCNVATYTDVTFSTGIGAFVSGLNVSLSMQAQLEIFPSYEDTGDGSFDKATSYYGYDYTTLQKTWCLPLLYTYVPQLNAQFQSTIFPSLSTIMFPTTPSPNATGAALPADLFITGNSGVTPWSVTPSTSLVASGQTVFFSVESLNSNSPPTVTWSSKPVLSESPWNGNVFTAPSVTVPTTFVIVASESSNPSVEVYATLTVVPAAVAISPQIAVIGAGMSMTFTASDGIDTTGPFSWSLNGGTAVLGATLVFNAPDQLTATTLSTITIVSPNDPNDVLATAYVVMTPTGAQPLGMTTSTAASGQSPVQGFVTNGPGNSVTITASATNGPTTIDFAMVPTGFGYGSLSAESSTNGQTDYLAPIPPPAAAFNVFVLATGTTDTAAWWGLAMVTVTPNQGGG